MAESWGHFRLSPWAIILLYAGKDDASSLPNLEHTEVVSKAAPIPARARTGRGLEANSTTDQEDTDNDNVLLLRQMMLTSLAQWGLQDRGGCPAILPSFLEQSRGPAECFNAPVAHKCSSIWMTPAVIHWARSLGLSLIHFDQCMLGQVAMLPHCRCCIGTNCGARTSMSRIAPCPHPQ